MFSKINVFLIVKDHFKTLKRLHLKSWISYIPDSIVFILIPTSIACVLVVNNYSYHDHIGSLIAAISIFGGFLFNLLALIYSQIDKIKVDALQEGNGLKKRFLNEIHTNISFCIVLAITIIISLLLGTVDAPKFKYSWLIIKVSTTFTYFLLQLFLLTLLMILRRVYILLRKESKIDI